MTFAIDKNQNTIDLIKHEYRCSINPWFIGYSGGKDSSALVALVFLSLLQIKNPLKPVTLLYCDTGVEIPVIASLVNLFLSKVTLEAKDLNIPLYAKVVKPLLADTFFVKVIGKGYPPPTNKFRWCTDRLRIKPINNFFSKTDKNNTILLGIRKGESIERDRIIDKHQTNQEYYYRQSGNAGSRIFTPLIDYSLEEVWATVAYNSLPKSLDAKSIMDLYKLASGECPIIREPESPPCGKGRFGCWICTVVRKDKAVTNLSDNGYEQLRPLLDFRNWIIEIRDNAAYRMPKRRNGQNGPGPFTMESRKLILQKLINAQKESGYSLISNEELEIINKLWAIEKT